MKNEGFLRDLEFDETQIQEGICNVNNDLKHYIEENIFPEYYLNDEGHNIEHIKYVLKRAFEISKSYHLNYDMLYTCVCFHDIACHINRDEHEVLSANRVKNDIFLNKYFNNEDIIIIAEAIEDYRASLKDIPRNIYGKILSSADRKVEVKVYLMSSMSFSKKENPKKSMDDCIEDSYQFAIKKFGVNGYAVNKNYVDDGRYKKFLSDIQYLINNKNEFVKVATEVYNKLR